MDTHSTVIELNAKPTQEDLRITYWRLASVCDHTYYMPNCSQINPENIDSYDLDIEVDLEHLENEILKSL